MSAMTRPPTPEEIADRARRADRGTRGAMAGVLGLEALVVLLVPRAIAFSTHGLGGTRTGILVALAVVLVVAAGMVRRPYGVALGSAMQLLLLVVTGVIIWEMFIIGALFLAVWWRLVLLRHQVVGTPGGARMWTS